MHQGTELSKFCRERLDVVSIHRIGMVPSRRRMAYSNWSCTLPSLMVLRRMWPSREGVILLERH